MELSILIPIMTTRQGENEMDKVIVDTCIWSEVFRRNSPDREIQSRMKELMLDLRVIMLGSIRQELLSGIKDEARFAKLKELLSVYVDEPILSEDYIKAAEFCNICRRNGIQGSAIDFLICAVAYRLKAEIFTTDKDFNYYLKYIPVELY